MPVVLRGSLPSGADVRSFVRTMSFGVCPYTNRPSPSVSRPCTTASLLSALGGQHLRSLSRLELTGLHITGEGAAALVTALEAGWLSGLRELRLRHGFNTDDGVEGLARALKGGACPLLQVLDLSGSGCMKGEALACAVQPIHGDSPCQALNPDPPPPGTPLPRLDP
jgi:hypothetical protein